MKKMITALLAPVLVLGLACPAFAATGKFVPSISYKSEPDVVVTNGAQVVIRDANGEILASLSDALKEGCLLITPLADAMDQKKDVPEDIRELLVDLYKALRTGDMTIPYEKHEADLKADKMSVRDLFDIRFVCEEHKAMMEQEGATLEITFDLDVAKNLDIYSMVYDEETEEWEPIVSTTNNQDGTVTFVFDRLGAVEFSVVK